MEHFRLRAILAAARKLAVQLKFIRTFLTSCKRATFFLNALQRYSGELFNLLCDLHAKYINYRCTNSSFFCFMRQELTYYQCYELHCNADGTANSI